MIRTAIANWSGGLKNGKGTLTTKSGALKNLPYNFSMRFEEEPGTSPEELIAAAHAGCFTMALSGDLEKAGFPAKNLSTEAKVTLEFINGAPTVTLSQLTLRAKVLNIDETVFKTIADGAKRNCPVSRLLNAKVTLDAHLES